MNFLKTAEYHYNNDIDQFILSLFPGMMNLLIEYESDHVTKKPSMGIIFNETGVFDQEIDSCTSNINLVLIPSLKTKQILEIKMHGKDSNGTLIDHGVITKDTFIRILSLKINNYSLLDDYDFFNENFYSVDANGIRSNPMSGFWSNSSLILEFDFPFDMWYNTKSVKNSTLSTSLIHRQRDDVKSLIENLVNSVKKLK